MTEPKLLPRVWIDLRVVPLKSIDGDRLAFIAHSRPFDHGSEYIRLDASDERVREAKADAWEEIADALASSGFIHSAKIYSDKAAAVRAGREVNWKETKLN